MADKSSPQKEIAVEAVAEEVKTTKPQVEAVDGEKEVTKTEENGENVEENGAEKEEKNGTTKEVESEKNGKSAEPDVCCVKRKSVGGGDATDSAVSEATSEKKAKIDEPTETESNGEATEVAA